MGLTNAFDSYAVTFVGTDTENTGGFLGWIRLLSAGTSAGYIYLEREASLPHLGNIGGPGSPYIVMSRLPSDFLSIMQLLNDGRSKQIRIFNEDTANASAFIEHVISTDNLEEAVKQGKV